MAAARTQPTIKEGNRGAKKTKEGTSIPILKHILYFNQDHAPNLKRTSCQDNVPLEFNAPPTVGNSARNSKCHNITTSQTHTIYPVPDLITNGQADFEIDLVNRFDPMQAPNLNGGREDPPHQKRKRKDEENKRGYSHTHTLAYSLLQHGTIYQF